MIARPSGPVEACREGGAVPPQVGWEGSTPVTVQRPVGGDGVLGRQTHPEPRRRCSRVSRLPDHDEHAAEEQQELVELIPEFVEERMPGSRRPRSRAGRQLPTEVVEGMEEIGIFRLMIPEESAASGCPAHLRAGRRGLSPG